MILKVSRAQAVRRRQRHVTLGGAETCVSTYMGTNAMELAALGQLQKQVADQITIAPMACLVEQSAGSTAEPHFHQVDPFQIFIGGSGQIGSQALNGVTVHDAGAHSAYGPIVAGPGQVLSGQPALSHGLFWYVLSGGLQSERPPLGAGACFFFSHEESPFEFHATDQGLELLQLQLSLNHGLG